MKSNGLMLAILTTLLIAPLAGCAPIVTRGIAGNCSTLIPSNWIDPETGSGTVPPVEQPVGAKLPDGHDDARPWQTGFAGQTGQLEKANDRTGDTVHIYKTCEQMQAAALKAATRKRILGIF